MVSETGSQAIQPIGGICELPRHSPASEWADHPQTPGSGLVEKGGVGILYVYDVREEHSGQKSFSGSTETIYEIY
jgi:hypothetical protein